MWDHFCLKENQQTHVASGQKCQYCGVDGPHKPWDSSAEQRQFLDEVNELKPIRDSDQQPLDN